MLISAVSSSASSVVSGSESRCGRKAAQAELTGTISAPTDIISGISELQHRQDFALKRRLLRAPLSQTARRALCRLASFPGGHPRSIRFLRKHVSSPLLRREQFIVTTPLREKVSVTLRAVARGKSVGARHRSTEWSSVSAREISRGAFRYDTVCKDFP
jgi:hypothetical protein